MSTTDGSQQTGDQGSTGGDSGQGSTGDGAGNGSTQGAGTASTKSWDELFAGQKPEDVAQALGHARTWEARAKENVDKAKQFDELQEANKTEAQKTADRIAELEKENAGLKSASVRLEVSAAKGVPAELLSGNTKEELEAAADKLLAFKGTTSTAASADGQGDTGTAVGDGKEKSAAEVVKAALG